MDLTTAFQQVSATYNRTLRLRNLDTPMWAALAYWPAVLAARGVPWLGLLQGDDPHIEVAGVHIHHMNIGLLLMLFGGLFLLGRRFRPLAAIGFGAGAGITLDEYSLILYVEDVYWQWRGVVASGIALGSAGIAFGVFAILAKDVLAEVAASALAIAKSTLRPTRGSPPPS
jgi:hypothetical protein